MNVLEKATWQLRRRAFLTRGATGLGMLALNSLLNPRLLAGEKWVPGLVELIFPDWF